MSYHSQIGRQERRTKINTLYYFIRDLVGFYYYFGRLPIPTQGTRDYCQRYYELLLGPHRTASQELRAFEEKHGVDYGDSLTEDQNTIHNLLHEKAETLYHTAYEAKEIAERLGIRFN